MKFRVKLERWAIVEVEAEKEEDIVISELVETTDWDFDYSIKVIDENTH